MFGVRCFRFDFNVPGLKAPIIETLNADRLRIVFPGARPSRVFGFANSAERSDVSEIRTQELDCLYRRDVRRSLPAVETDLAQLANDRFEIADTLHRYAFGLDHGDADSLASALREDCRFDFTPAGRKLGLDFPRVTGRDAILKAVLPLIGPLDTSHTASNLQIEISGDSRRGSEFALLMNRYDCELVRDGEKWRFKRVTIDNAWAQGDPEILNALASHHALQTKPKRPA